MRERGSGSLFREKYRDKKTGQLKVCQTWTMKLWVGGQPLKRSSGTASRAVANKRLEQWKAALRQGVYVPDADQTRFDDLATLLLNEYRANGRKSLDRVEDAVDHLRELFTGCRAQAISTERILAYVRHRQEQKAAHATIKEADPGIVLLQHVDVRLTDDPPRFLTKPEHPLERRQLPVGAKRA